MSQSVYINLEDDVARVTARLKKEKASELILVCPKRCQLFADSINLRLLKKQADLLKKKIFILTMDERGQIFAREAGFALKFLPKHRPGGVGVTDISPTPKPTQPENMPRKGLVEKVKTATSFVSGLVSKKKDESSALDTEVKTLDTFTDSAIFKSPMVSSPVLGHKPDLAARGRQRAARTIRRPNLAASLALALALLTVLGLVFVVLPQATVVIYPKFEPVTRDFDVSLDVASSGADALKLVLPGVKIDQTLEAQAKFKTQGKKDVGNKAIGRVRIYNFTGQFLNLRAETTALIAGNQTYRLVEDALQIKPTRYKNSATKEIDESSLSSPFEIIAVTGGEAANLPAGVRLEITNQVFGSRPQIVFAKTETPISGGTTRFLAVISENDITTAREELNKMVLNQLNLKLGSQGLQLIENAYRTEVLEFSSDQSVGTEMPTFGAKIKVKVTGLAFSPRQLKELVIKRVSQTFPPNRELKTEKDFNLVYKIRNVDLNSFTGVLNIHFEGKAVLKVDPSVLPNQLIGKSRQQASEILQTVAEIDTAEVTLTPVWQKNFPWFRNKIQIQVAE